MSNPENLQPVLEKMRRSWGDRAVQDAQYYVYTGTGGTEDFEASGRVNYEQIVRPFLPVLLRGRSPQQCRVVEIGCGVGRMTRCFAEEFLEVHGVDVAAEMVAKARERLAGYRNVSLHMNSGMDLEPLPDQYFDLAFSYLVFQHIPSRDVIANYIREAARVLKPGGALHFQLNGYRGQDYLQGEKDTWLGESFSFSEAIQMLREAGFRPLNSIGAGTQYFILTARRTGEPARPLSSFLLPGQARPPGQFLEGWGLSALGDCLPMGTFSRVLLGLPPERSLRLFLALHFGPGNSFPVLTVTLEGCVLGAVEITSAGDHYWEWRIPPSLCRNSRALVTLSLDPAQPEPARSLRSVGIYAPEEENRDSKRAPESLAVREAETSEGISWTANAERECARLAGLLSEREAEAERKVTWALSLENDLEAARKALFQLQAEFQDRTSWALALESELKQFREALSQLHAEFQDRTSWALALENDLEAARKALFQLQAEFQDRTSWALSLDRDLEKTQSLLAQSQQELSEIRFFSSPRLWLGKKLRSALKSGKG